MSEKTGEVFSGAKDIHLGPVLPAFLPPNVAKGFLESFGITGLSTVDEDSSMKNKKKYNGGNQNEFNL